MHVGATAGVAPAVTPAAALESRVAGARAGAIVDGWLARRLRVEPVADAVVALAIGVATAAGAATGITSRAAARLPALQARIAGARAGAIVDGRIAGRLIVNELLGTSWGPTTFEGTYLISGGVCEITNSSGVSWAFTEVRP